MFEEALAEIGALTPSAIAIMMLVGILVGIAPGSLPLAVAAAGLIAGRKPMGRWKGPLLAGAFVFGTAIVDALLGALFGWLGFLVLRVLAAAMAYVYFVLSGLLIIAGLALLRVVRLNFRLLRLRAGRTDTFGRAFVLGLLFGFSTCPACTPLVLPVLMAAGTSADPVMGGILLFTFGLARGLPILVLAAAADWILRFHATATVVKSVERATGLLLLLAAAWFAYRGAEYGGLWG